MSGAETLLRCVSPIDGAILVEREYAAPSDVEHTIARAAAAARTWQQVPLEERATACRAFVGRTIADTPAAVDELARQMGRPVRSGGGEFRGFEERALRMIDLAPQALSDIEVPTDGLGRRFIRRIPLGVYLVIAPWNYPYLTAVNSIVPALMAGNAVILKHSHQTPLCAERLIAAAEAAGAFPKGLFTYLHLDRAQTLSLIRDDRIGGVAFTGSVAGGIDVEQAAAGRFIPVGLELGGKDPAYVRADADLPRTVENLVDGSFFNSGQSCCGIERIYVHADVHDDFVESFCALTRDYVLGNPLDGVTTLGPLVRASAARFVREQITEALEQGAAAHIPPEAFQSLDEDTAYLAPQVLTSVTHDMRFMREETFGPAVGIMRVQSDEEALSLMNDSPYGLTASVWTTDTQTALALGERIETGTVFLNRCDYLDPDLAWTGMKDTGRGATLSMLGYGQVTRPKSFNFLRAS